MNDDWGSWLREAKQDVQDYLKLRSQLLRLEGYEKVSKVTGALISFFVLFLAGMIVAVFVLIVLASIITQLTHSHILGYGAVTFIGALAFLLCLFNRKAWLQLPVADRIIEALYEEDDFDESDGELYGE